jgi:hypothetical protein
VRPCVYICVCIYIPVTYFLIVCKCNMVDIIVFIYYYIIIIIIIIIIILLAVILAVFSLYEELIFIQPTLNL